MTHLSFNIQNITNGHIQNFTLLGAQNSDNQLGMRGRLMINSSQGINCYQVVAKTPAEVAGENLLYPIINYVQSFFEKIDNVVPNFLNFLPGASAQTTDREYAKLVEDGDDCMKKAEEGLIRYQRSCEHFCPGKGSYSFKTKIPELRKEIEKNVETAKSKYSKAVSKNPSPEDKKRIREKINALEAILSKLDELALDMLSNQCPSILDYIP